MGPSNVPISLHQIDLVKNDVIFALRMQSHLIDW